MICFSRLGNLGQLGNQLFQVAATLAAAERFGTEAKFPAWKYARFFQGPFDETLAQSNIANTYYERRARFSPIPNLSDLDLFGFFQSQRYFIDGEVLVRRSFTFKSELLPLQWRNIESDCSIHIRRRDYLKRTHEFVPLQMDYYERAIQHMRTLGCRSFIIFSDDVDWCQKNFPSEFTIVDDLTDVQSLCLMSKCKHHIIANSTFSWWGSWLCQNPKKIVIAPQIWYGLRASIRNNDLYQYCADWHLIPNQVSLRSQILSLIRSKEKRHFLLSYVNREKWMEEEYEAFLRESECSSVLEDHGRECPPQEATDS